MASPEANLNSLEIAFQMDRLAVMQILTQQVVTTSPDTLAKAACDLMLKHEFGPLPAKVEGGLVGILTESDIFRLVAQRWSKSEGVV